MIRKKMLNLDDKLRHKDRCNNKSGGNSRILLFLLNSLFLLTFSRKIRFYFIHVLYICQEVLPPFQTKWLFASLC